MRVDRSRFLCYVVLSFRIAIGRLGRSDDEILESDMKKFFVLFAAMIGFVCGCATAAKPPTELPPDGHFMRAEPFATTPSRELLAGEVVVLPFESRLYIKVRMTSGQEVGRRFGCFKKDDDGPQVAANVDRQSCWPVNEVAICDCD